MKFERFKLYYSPSIDRLTIADTILNTLEVELHPAYGAEPDVDRYFPVRSIVDEKTLNKHGWVYIGEFKYD